MSATHSSWRSLLLAGVIALGLTSAWFLVTVTLFSIGARSLVNGGHPEQLHVRVDGEPVLVRLAATGMTQQVQTLDREPTTGDAYQILYPSYVGSPGQDNLSSGREWTNRLASISDGGSPAVYWYLVHDGLPNGRAYGVGYHSATKRIVGYFGREGFGEVMPPRESWFQVAGNLGLAYATPERMYYEPYWFTQPSLYVLANGQLWEIDTRKRTVESIERCPDAFAVGWAWQTSDKLPERNDRAPNQAASTLRSLLVRTPETCLLIDPQSGDVKRYALSPAQHSDSVAGFQLADGRLLLVSQDRRATKELHLMWLDPAGKVVSEKRLTLDMPQGGVNEPELAGMSAVAAPGTLWQLVFVFMLTMHTVTTGTDSAPAGIGHALAIAWPGLLVVLTISSIAAWGAYRRQRQFGLPGAAIWGVFVFVFGIPGWLAYRWHRIWPVMEDCPHCRQPAPRDREECTECGAEYPPPELKGTEVFA